MKLLTLHVWSRTFVRASMYVLAGLWLLWIWIPLIWTFFTGFAANPQSYPPELIPSEMTLEHYERVLYAEGFHRYLINSTVVTTVSTAISVAVGSLAAYALTRYNPGEGHVSFFILSMRFLPPIAVAIPIYLMFVGLGWIDSWRALMVTYLTIGIPIATWIMLIFFQKIPIILEDAARMDGWSRLQTWWRVVLPLAAPGIASAAILTAILMWNEYVIALVLTTTPDAQTIPVYLAGFVTTRGTLWGSMGAATIIAITPVVLLAFFTQEKLVAGFTLEDVE